LRRTSAQPCGEAEALLIGLKIPETFLIRATALLE
jgi:hypothetical protein